MRKKRIGACLLLLVLVILIISISANAQTEQEKVARAYEWLARQVQGKWQNLNVKQHVFSLLALQCNKTYFETGSSSLHAKKFSERNISCWGLASKPASQEQCLLTETALAKIALDSFGENTSKITRWLLSRNMTQVQNINWYLQIDVEKGTNASCEIIYAGNEENVFEIGTDKKAYMTGTSKCFYVDESEPYWFRIKPNQDCYSYSYTIKCWSNSTIYRASLLYKKTGSVIWHVSAETKTGKPGIPGSNRIEDQPDPLELKVSSYCLANPTNIGICDYEGTAWTAYALSRSDNEKALANLFVPYLVIFAEDNAKVFPAAFLYHITGQARYMEEILASQKIVGVDKGYWIMQPIVYGRVYDSALAALALATGSDAVTKAKNYLLANQELNGNLVSTAYGEPGKDPIRDTAFALWVLWPLQCPSTIACTEMGSEYSCKYICDADEIEISDLECETGKTCCKKVTAEEDCASAGGECKDYCEEDEFETEIPCPYGLVCCKPYSKATCKEIGGTICRPEENCSGEEVETLDGTCCLGICGGTSERYCSEIGEECMENEVCIKILTWHVTNFVSTKDTERCCVGNAKCVQDKTCASIGGKKCGPNEECKGTVVETRDEEECCKGECLASCSAQGGTICNVKEKCDGVLVFSSDYPNEKKCCIGECKKQVSLWWVWIVAILAIGIIVFFIYKRKPKPKEKPSVFPLIKSEIKPVKPPAPIPSKPILPTATKPIPKEITVTPTEKPKPALKPKTKTEEELEKTLRKLKKLTKK